MEVHGATQCQVAAISEGGDDQPGTAAQVLIAVDKTGIGLKDVTVVTLFIPLIPQLSARFCYVTLR